MRPRRIEILPSFERAYDDLPEALQDEVDNAVQRFIDRTAENALRPERKGGRLSDVWTFRLKQGYRVFYTQAAAADGRICQLFHVGPHDDYRTVRRKKPKR